MIQCLDGAVTMKWLGWGTAAVPLVIASALAGCSSLPKLDARAATTAMRDTADTRLGKAVQAAAAAHPGRSGIYPLEVPTDAFAARVLLMRAADRSLDVQYYIWHGDITGYLLFGELWDAADRGVRVRLLLDDNGIAGLDAVVAALDSHPNIEVRLFNPFVNRRFKALGFLTDFNRANRRMHNKSLTADTQATIVGGRNVGDEYFGAGMGTVFADLDVLAVGRAASDVAGEFDLYWNSDSAYPTERIIGPAKPDMVPALKAKVASVRASPEAGRYVEALEATRMVEALIARNLPIEWVPVRLVYDEPTKALAKADDTELLFARLNQAIGKAQREIDLVSPYFVPGKEGTAALSALPQQGIRLRIVTNSLAATDVGAVHAGYAKRREPLLRSGAKIYELKPDATTAQARESGRANGGAFGSSSASLHAKTFSVDRNRVFVGSFNFDPRSVRLNTEMGLVIESPALADAISSRLDQEAQGSAYEVVLGKNGGLEWVEHTEQGEVRYTREPKTGFFKRLGVGFMSLLPIEGML